ncbi:MAG: hypothetical protein QOD09_3889 [Bradyrhizobium sp.]|jgi:uncharacterized membrane protein|nr:hypothetical protein [Bradyrhizobium sp.]
MSIDQRFLIAIATMALIAYGCRVAGLLVGTCLGESAKLRRILDLLPACAIAAVLGPSLGAMTVVQGGALLVSVAVFLMSSRFLLALTLGTVVLFAERWLA